MAIAEVRKVHLLAHRGEAAAVVGFLQSEGVVEVTAASEGAGSRDEGGGEDLEATANRIDQALRLLRPFAPPLSLLEKIYSSRPRLTTGEISMVADTFDLDGFLDRCEKATREIEALQGEKNRIEEEKEALLPWAALDAPPLRLHRSSRIDVVAGRFPAASREPLLRAFGKTEVFMEIVGEDEREVRAVIICHRSRSAALRESLSQARFQEAALPALDCRPAERIADLERKRRELGARIEELRGSYRLLAASRKELMILRDLVAGRLERFRAEGLMGRTDRTVSVEGWAAARDLPRLRRRLTERFTLASLEDFDPDPRDRVPVLLENAPVVRPFGLVVDLYGLPRYGAVDPSAVMAFFFALFFALCLTDAGYGLFLAAVTGLLLAAAPPDIPLGRKRFLQMFCLCGIATVAAGAAAGGWLGFQAPWRLFDPLEDLMLFFFIALAAGTLHLFAGLTLRMVRLTRSGDLFAALIDHGLWMVLIVSLYGVAAGKGQLVSPAVGKAAGTGAVAAALAIVFFQGRPGGVDGEMQEWTGHIPWAGAALAGTLWLAGTARPWSAAAFVVCLAVVPLLPGGSTGRMLGRIGLGLYALYGITGYLSDVLSYSRLVALGLGTGIVALVVNKMAVVAQGMPVVGAAMAALVFVGGHLFNILINLLGAFVHSCRLQYVEFFTKFYESGGKPIAPFRLATRYITIAGQT